VKRKLVKRPLRRYALGNAGEVYGYEWGAWECLVGVAGTATGVAGTYVTAASGQWWAAWVTMGATAVIGGATWYNCKHFIGL